MTVASPHAGSGERDAAKPGGLPVGESAVDLPL